MVKHNTMSMKDNAMANLISLLLLKDMICM
jgi:hypothetical protein